MQYMELEQSKVADFRGCAVLIHSRDRRFLDYYRSMFLTLGFSPVITSTPEAATAVLRLTVVAYVIVDLETGLQGSRQVIHYARRTQGHSPVIAISRKSDRSFRHEAAALGATDYLEHPALQDDIVHALIPNHPYAQRSAHSSSHQ